MCLSGGSVVMFLSVWFEASCSLLWSSGSRWHCVILCVEVVQCEPPLSGDVMV